MGRKPSWHFLPGVCPSGLSVGQTEVVGRRGIVVRPHRPLQNTQTWDPRRVAFGGTTQKASQPVQGGREAATAREGRAGCCQLSKEVVPFLLSLVPAPHPPGMAEGSFGRCGKNRPSPAPHSTCLFSQTQRALGEAIWSWKWDWSFKLDCTKFEWAEWLRSFESVKYQGT